MSSSDDAIGQRETAYRLFATEFEDSDFSHAESDEERAPNYVITPTGARVNRLFVVGVLTEVQPVSEDVLRARIVDPTGAFVVYAGQYQPDAQTFLERADPPMFVAVAGKARTFQPDDGDVIYTSIRPESVNEVDAETRDRWTVEAARQTLDRVGTMASAIESDSSGDALRQALASQDVPEGLAAGVPLAIDHYGTSGPYLESLRETALDALRVVAGEREEVTERSVAPDAPGEADLGSLADVALPAATPETTEPEPEPTTVSADSRAGDATPSDSGNDESAPEPTDTTPESEAEPATEDTTASATADSTEPVAEDTITSAAADQAETVAEDTTASATEDTTAPDVADTTEPAETDDLGDFEPGEFDLDEETREEVESEYGTDFQSGTEVEEPGQADIETPAADAAEAAPDSVETPAPDATSDTATESTPDAADDTETESTPDSVADTETEPTPDTETEPTQDTTSVTETEDVDLEDAVMETMRDVDDGDGADREAVTAAVIEQYGSDPEAVEDAIQDALMDGRCYEPDDETLKPI